MLGGKSVIMAGVCLRGDLYRKKERSTEGEKEGPATAISVGRYVIFCGLSCVREY